MKTDTLFYELFQATPGLFFELLGLEQSLAQSYRMRAIEVKQTGFRLDGVFMPAQPQQPLYFLECQFQKDAWFYQRLFAEIFLYFRREKVNGHWGAVVLFARRSLDPGLPATYRSLESSGQLQRFYMQEQAEAGSLTMAVLQLITCPKRRMRRHRHC